MINKLDLSSFIDNSTHVFALDLQIKTQEILLPSTTLQLLIMGGEGINMAMIIIGSCVCEKLQDCACAATMANVKMAGCNSLALGGTNIILVPDW